MTEPQGSFEHAASFEPGEISGNLGLGKLETMYSELFADVIEDGVITADEPAELERTATALGLDRERLAALEAALQAVYEQRNRVRIVEVDASGAASAHGSLTPMEPPTDARSQALERRVAFLEARVKDLEKELEEAHANVAVEVDLSGIEAAAEGGSSADPETLRRRLARDPRDVETLRALYRVHAAAGDVDRRGCVKHALVYVGAATIEEKEAYEAILPEGLIKPTTSLSNEAWRRSLFHPDEEVITGDIFSVIVSAVLVGRVAALRRGRASSCATICAPPARCSKPTTRRPQKMPSTTFSSSPRATATRGCESRSGSRRPESRRARGRQLAQ